MDNSYFNMTDELTQQVRDHAEQIFRVIDQFRSEGMALVTRIDMLESEKTQLEHEKDMLQAQNQSLQDELSAQREIIAESRTPAEYPTEPTF